MLPQARRACGVQLAGGKMWERHLLPLNTHAISRAYKLNYKAEMYSVLKVSYK